MHGALVEEDENGQGQGVGERALYIRHRIYYTKYSCTSMAGGPCSQAFWGASPQPRQGPRR
jgi:hypothetical protein